MEREIRQVLVRAGMWARAREKCRSISDSKSAKPHDLDKARAALTKASEQLADAVMKLEALLWRRKPRGRKRTVDWHAVFGAVGILAKATGAALARPPVIVGRVRPPHVIDTTAEE